MKARWAGPALMHSDQQVRSTLNKLLRASPGVNNDDGRDRSRIRFRRSIVAPASAGCRIENCARAFPRLARLDGRPGEQHWIAARETFEPGFQGSIYDAD
jgi:hypothetical protein